MSTRPKGSGRVLIRKQVNRWSRGGIWETGVSRWDGTPIYRRKPPTPAACCRLLTLLAIEGPALPSPVFGALVINHSSTKRSRTFKMRTLTSYGIAVVIVFAILNGIFWLIRNPRLHDLNLFSAGFVLGMLGMYIAAWLYGYRQLGF